MNVRIILIKCIVEIECTSNMHVMHIALINSNLVNGGDHASLPPDP